ncbi:hypothetical protein AB0L40_15500 [Patulibacter sp. NPDC049589]|uniref:hypothetical protein n=1 Tax=Patulibacter sp. NPDC049589 TaxID=3154731 RepID=UPI0034329DB2
MTHTPTPRTIALGLAATLAIGTGTVAVASAADSAPAKPTAPTPEQRAEKREAAKTTREAAFAKALGVSVADLERARGDVQKAVGQKRAEAEKQRAETKGLTVQQLRDQRADKVQKRLAKAVANKRLTQAEADAVVKAVREGKAVRPLVKKARAEHRQDRQERRADRRAQRQAAAG